MRKRCILLLLVCTLLMGCVCPAQASIGNEDRYRSAQNELIRYFNGENSKTLDALCADFAALGRYEESPSFLYYTSILRDLEAEDFSRIELYLMLIRTDTDFCAMMEDGALPSVTELEAYARGRKAEAEHDGQLALAYYQKCNAMLDSQERMVVLIIATPAPNPTPTPSPTPAPVIIEENVQAGDYKITTYSNDTCIITGYTGKAAELDIPVKIDRYTIMAIGDSAFRGCDFLINVTIPDGITSIGDYAFYECECLTGIIIPNSITSIGRGAFYCCKSLVDIVIPEGVTTISEQMFQECTSLSSITIPVTITAIGHAAFSSCKSLTSIAIPLNVSSIGGAAFEYCYGLNNIVIPDGITSIEPWTFFKCKSLTSVTIPDSVTSIGYDVFFMCPNLTLCVPLNSYAHQYAIDNSRPYVTY